VTIPALRKLAAIYGCVVTLEPWHIIIYDSAWKNKEQIDRGGFSYKKAQDIVPVLERLSGLKSADLWKVRNPIAEARGL